MAKYIYIIYIYIYMAKKTSQKSWVCLVLWHINYGRLLNGKSSLYIYMIDKRIACR